MSAFSEKTKTLLSNIITEHHERDRLLLRCDERKLHVDAILLQNKFYNTRKAAYILWFIIIALNVAGVITFFSIQKDQDSTIKIFVLALIGQVFINTVTSNRLIIMILRVPCLSSLKFLVCTEGKNEVSIGIEDYVELLWNFDIIDKNNQTQYNVHDVYSFWFLQLAQEYRKTANNQIVLFLSTLKINEQNDYLYNGDYGSYTRTTIHWVHNGSKCNAHDPGAISVPLYDDVNGNLYILKHSYCKRANEFQENYAVHLLVDKVYNTLKQNVATALITVTIP